MTLKKTELFSLEELVTTSIENVVAVEQQTDNTAEIFIRNHDKVSSREITYSPFFLIADPEILHGFSGNIKITEFNGREYFRFLVECENLKVYQEALKYIKKTTGTNPSAPDSPYKVISDYQQQIMIQSRFRLFRGMKFSDTRRLQFDIETITTEGFDFPNPKRKDDQIVVISMSDNTGWEQCLMQSSDKTEKDILYEFVCYIQDRDPDILEGHNIFRFDLPFIEERAKLHKIKLNLGRNGSKIKSRSSLFTAAERSISYKRYDIYGRHITDTYFLVQIYDIINRDLDSYGLKEVAKHFGVAAPERTYLDASDIRTYFNEKQQLLEAYAMDDVRETKSIAEILSPSSFYQVQLEPLSYQNIIVRGNATKIETLFLASYLNSRESIPLPQPPKKITGGLTKSFRSGVFKNVWHCDISSLYPSVMLAEKLYPGKDKLHVFSHFLKKLREFRLTAKKAEKKAGTGEIREFYNSLQTTFKIIINSFYGYLAFAYGSFNDFDSADKVTSRGREILTSMLNFLNEKNACVIEMDTDGIYFQPPENITDPVKFEQEIQNILPEGIDVELDSVYKSMFSYKSKNYALLTENGEVGISGAALKSRGVEPFIRSYMKNFITLLLKEKSSTIEKMTNDLKQSILDRTIPLEKLAKTETLQDSLDKYKKKMSSGKGRRSAAYELALKSNRSYRQGDQISYYVTGNKKRVSVVDNSKLLSENNGERDENTQYYITKLEDIYKKFKTYI
ncbi:MAG: hypothetical protein K9M56_09065 [Victivallales bacterium]|nr:hypothetical protein [Victivallales bacterium]